MHSLSPVVVGENGAHGVGGMKNHSPSPVDVDYVAVQRDLVAGGGQAGMDQGCLAAGSKAIESRSFVKVVVNGKGNNYEDTVKGQQRAQALKKGRCAYELTKACPSPRNSCGKVIL